MKDREKYKNMIYYYKLICCEINRNSFRDRKIDR